MITKIGIGALLSACLLTSCSEVWVATNDDEETGFVQGWRSVDLPFPAAGSELEQIGKYGSIRLSLPPQPSVINLWSSACAPCRKELPWLQELQDRGASVVGISRDIKVRYAVDEMGDRGVIHPNYSDASGDFTVALGSVLPINAVPTTIIVAEGRVRWVHVGPFDSYADLEASVTPKLAALGPGWS